MKVYMLTYNICSSITEHVHANSKEGAELQASSPYKLLNHKEYQDELLENVDINYHPNEVKEVEEVE